MKKTDYLKLVLLGVGLTVAVSVFSAIGVMTSASDNGMILYQIAAFLLAGILLAVYMKKSEGSFRRFGFSANKVHYRYYIMAAIIVFIQPLMLGVNFSLTVTTIALLVLQMLVVGFTEEALFRAIYFDKLQAKGPLMYIVFSSAVFGILHSASAINPDATAILVILQVINAFLLGIVFSSIYYLTRNIYLLIAFHASFNIFASISNAGSVEENITSVCVLSAVYVLIIIFLYVQRNRMPYSVQQ